MNKTFPSILIILSVLTFCIYFTSCKKDIDKQIELEFYNPEVLDPNSIHFNQVLDTNERLPFVVQVSNGSAARVESATLTRINADGREEVINIEAEPNIMTSFAKNKFFGSIEGDIYTGKAAGIEKLRCTVTDIHNRVTTVEKEIEVVLGGPPLEFKSSFRLVHAEKHLQGANCAQQGHRFNLIYRDKNDILLQKFIENIDSEIDTFYGSWTGFNETKFVFVENIDPLSVNQGALQTAYENGAKMDTVLRPVVGEMYVVEVAPGLGYLILEVREIKPTSELCTQTLGEYQGEISCDYYYSKKNFYE
ncbi:MAG: hypothetical protein ACJAZ3_001023 [Sphingobacteriales bacterium]|jgi:hypothetical protein